MGRPQIARNGLPGNLVDSSRAGITPRTLCIVRDQGQNMLRHHRFASPRCARAGKPAFRRVVLSNKAPSRKILLPLPPCGRGGTARRRGPNVSRVGGKGVCTNRIALGQIWIRHHGFDPPHPSCPGWRKRRLRATLSPKGATERIHTTFLRSPVELNPLKKARFCWLLRSRVTQPEALFSRPWSVWHCPRIHVILGE
jgi:hypothetical protein